MAKYILLLLQLLYLALALPIHENTNKTLNVNITNDLLNLSKSCENSFLRELIKTKLEFCNTVPAYNQRNMDCLIFYDMSSQLCTAFGRSEMDLKLNYASNINTTYALFTLCDLAKDWKPMTPRYKIILDQLFQKKALCVGVCKVVESLSEDSNFYCKYYKWGVDMLKLKNKHPLTEVISSNDPLNPESLPETKSDAAITTNNGPISQNNHIEPQHTHKDLLDTSTKEEVLTKDDALKQYTTKKSRLPPIISTTKVNEEVKENKNNELPQSNLINKEPINVEGNQDPMKIDVNKEIKDIDKEGDFKAVVDNPKDNLDQDLDDTNNDFGTDLDPDDEPLPDADNNDGNFEPKVEKPSQESSNTNKLPHTFMDISQREVYPNAIQDSISEEDDHFFPFFLTSIVFVVLLYILYHNKSKVTKLILGLIVEGRQTNRRRNSRGHAYRRLDTLEQAMSANSTAPPSKIIY